MFQQSAQIWRQGLPDPTRSHGAWVFLLLSATAGLSLAGDQWLSAFVAISGFVGFFLLSSVLARRLLHKNRSRLALGLVLAMGAPLVSLSIGANPVFFVVGSFAALPMALGGYLAFKLGFQSAPVLALFVAVLVLAAPCAAAAGDASLLTCFGLLFLLLPFFCWRTIRVRRMLRNHEMSGRAALRAAGLRESIYATLWTIGTIILAHIVL